MAYDVFISYKSENAGCCDLVNSLLVTKLKYQVFRDRHGLAAGMNFVPQLEKALSDPTIKPVVVLLCTLEAVMNPKEILRELELARENQLIVVPVQFDAGASEALLEKAGFENPGTIHHIDACSLKRNPGAQDQAALLVLEDDLRRALTLRALEFLDKQRTRAKVWADEVLERARPSFWTGNWQHFFKIEHDLPKSTVLLARGGAGKTVLAAHLLDDLLKAPSHYPVFLTAEDLFELDKFAEKFNARDASTLMAQIRSMQEGGENRLGWESRKLTFIIDSFERIPIPGLDDLRRLCESLRLLSESAPMVITSRTEAWKADSRFQIATQCAEVRLRELEDKVVNSILKRYERRSNPKTNISPIFHLPFYLDYLCRQLSSDRPIATVLQQSESDILNQILSDQSSEFHSDKFGVTPATCRTVLKKIALKQFETLRFDVTEGEIDADADEAEAIERLLAGRSLVATDTSVGRTMRLRHDLLDAYSVVCQVLTGDAQENIRNLCARIHVGIGRLLCTALVQALYDFSPSSARHKESLRFLFAEFLRILDYKSIEAIPDSNVKAWSVTEVLQSTAFNPLLDLILEALGAEKAASVDNQQWDSGLAPVSRIGGHACITREAASTLGSAFLSVGRGSNSDIPRVIPVLKLNLNRWGRFRARYIEALAKYDAQESLDPLLQLGEQMLAERTDIETLHYVLQNLPHITVEKPKIKEFLGKVYESAWIDVESRRLAALAANQMVLENWHVPDRAEEGLIAGLKTTVGDTEQYTDWRKVQETADYIRDRLKEGHEYSHAVIEQLINALAHKQRYARLPVIHALGFVADVHATIGLLEYLMGSDISRIEMNEVEQALQQQIRRLRDLRERQLRRFLVQFYSRLRLPAANSMLAPVLAALALDRNLRTREDLAATEDALEVAPLDARAVKFLPADKGIAIDPSIEAEVTSLLREELGPDLETKYRLVGLAEGHSATNLVIAETTWTVGKGFHVVASKDPEIMHGLIVNLRFPPPFGDLQLPGLLSVHCILITADDNVICTRRSRLTAYSRECWSISFEEQLNDSDVLEYRDPISHAVLRGVKEELLLTEEEVESAACTPLAVILESNIFNFAIVCLVRIGKSAGEICNIWESRNALNPSGEVDCVEGRSLAQFMQAGNEGIRLGQNFDAELHPTSLIRLQLLRKWHGRNKD